MPATRRGLLVAALGAFAPEANAQSSPDEAQRRYIERSREAATTAEPPTQREQRSSERSALLAQGESALARGDVGNALAAFERAALMLHAADTEMALVRTYMQAGEYRRAVSFSAHTAGAHRQAVAGRGALCLAALARRAGRGGAAAARQHVRGDACRSAAA